MHGPEGIGLLDAILLVVHVYAIATHDDGSGKGTLPDCGQSVRGKRW